ncbi:hypothetical protein M3223_21480 [Paenibacillus pasadenensis]|uniref:hypothetical protein n=1 Tax=Paenibacillus pasadenensis TaxID=217090 RepID=UPI00203DE0FB|nr:hypothetical protein [Paenibacillus pasadenensis]MCM3749910.1 hypothetical protein [Paenibacillus pasadenensis]
MRVMLRQAGMELRSLMLLRWTLLLPGAAAVWMLLHTWRLRPESSQDVNLYAAETHIMLLMLTTAIPLLLGVLLMRRDLLHPSAEWLFRLPVSAGGWMAAKWLAGFAYMTLYTAAVSAAYAASALRHGLPLSSIWSQIGTYALLYEQSFALSLALGLFLGVLLPLRFSLPAAFCAWVFGSLFLQAYIRPAYEWNWLKAFYLQPLFDNSLFGNELWSFELAKDELFRGFAFGLVFALFLLIAGSALLGRSKPPLVRSRPWLLALAAFVAAAAAFLPFAALQIQRSEHQQLLEASAAPYKQLQDPALFRFRLERLELEARMLPKSRLEAEARLDIPTVQGKLLSAQNDQPLKYAKEGTVSLLLYPSLEVQSVEINGVPVHWEREADSIRFAEQLFDPRLHLQRVTISYSGVLNEWQSGPGGSESYLAFIRNSAVYLPASLGWYPLPGGDTLLALDEKDRLLDRPAASLTPETDYEVVLSGFDTKLFGTLPAGEAQAGRLKFQGVSADGLTLIGGRFEQVRLAGEPVEIITTAGNVDEAYSFLERFHERRKGLEAVTGTPLDTVNQIFFFPMHLIGTNTDSATRSWHAENNTLFIPQTERRNLDGYAEDALSTLLLFGDTGRGAGNARKGALANNSGQASIAVEIRSAYAYLYNKTSGKDTPFRLESKESAAWIQMRSLIDAAYENGYADNLYRLLEQFRQSGLTLPEPPRNEAGERLSASSVPIVTFEQFMLLWSKFMPETSLMPTTQPKGG